MKFHFSMADDEVLIIKSLTHKSFNDMIKVGASSDYQLFEYLDRSFVILEGECDMMGEVQSSLYTPLK